MQSTQHALNAKNKLKKNVAIVCRCCHHTV